MITNNNTMQAGDPSLMYYSQNKKINYSQFDATSLLSLNNDYDKLLADNYTELKMKCLNELGVYERSGRPPIREFDRPRKRQNLTHVDVKVPSAGNGQRQASSNSQSGIYRNFKSGNLINGALINAWMKINKIKFGEISTVKFR